MKNPFNSHLEVRFWDTRPNQRHLRVMINLVDRIIRLDDGKQIWLERDTAEIQIYRDCLSQGLQIIAWHTELRQLVMPLEVVLHQHIPNQEERRENPWLEDLLQEAGSDPEILELRRAVTKVTLWNKLPDGYTQAA